MLCRVWSRFQATRRDGSSIKLRIQDLPKNRIDDAVDLYTKYFIHEEPLLKAAGVPKNPKAVTEYRSIIRELMKDATSQTTICCEDVAEGYVKEIVGASLMLLVTERKDDWKQLWKKQAENDEMRLYFKLDEISDLHKQMKKLQISTFYDDIGMIVHPRFRKLGIATEFAKARRAACVAHNVAATGGASTAAGTQGAARRDRWRTVAELALDELGQKHGVAFEKGAVSRLVIWQNPEFKHNQNGK